MCAFHKFAAAGNRSVFDLSPTENIYEGSHHHWHLPPQRPLNSSVYSCFYCILFNSALKHILGGNMILPWKDSSFLQWFC